MMVDSLTRERDEERSSAAEKFNSLEIAYKEKVKNLEQQILDTKATAEQEVVQLKQRLELQLKEMRESLQQKHKQLEHYRETTTLLDQKLASTQLHHADAEEQHQKELQQYSIELDKLKNEQKLTVMELSQQLEVVGNKQKVLAQENNEFRKLIAEKEVEHADLQSMFNEQEKEYLNILQQLDQLTKEKDKLLDSKQNQLVAEQQMKMMTQKLEQLHDEKVKITDEYEAYQSVMQQKEIGLLHEVTELKQENKVVLQKNEQLIKQQHETVAMLEQKLDSSLADFVKDKEQHQKELQQYSAQLNKLNDQNKSKIMELSQQLEMATKEYEAFQSKINQQYTQECEEFSKKISEKELEYADLQSMFNKQEEEYVQQFEKLTEEKDKLLLDLKQTQLVAKQQVGQLNNEKEMMNKRLNKVHDEKSEMATEYQAYQSMMQEKEVNLSQEITKLKQEKSVALQKLDEGLGKLALMEDEHKKLYVQLDDLNNTLQCLKSEHVVEIESYQAALDRGLSDNGQLKVKNNLLQQELDSVRQESSALAEKLQSCLDTEAKNTFWQQQVKQLEDDLCKVHEQLSSKELSIQQLSNDLFSSKQECCNAIALLEQKKEELAQLEANHQTFRKNRAALLEEKESAIALLCSKMANEKQQNKIELETVHKENEELLKSVDKLYSHQLATNTHLEQDCQKKLIALQQENDAKFEEVAKMQVEMTSLLNELKELKLNHKEVIDCLNVETEKNSLLENEAKQLKATIKAYEKENARLNKSIAQQKYGPRSSEDEQAHLQQLHTEMDQLASSHVIPSQPAQETGDGSNRLEELKARNSLHPPHLKSCYPVELQLQCGTPKSSELQLKNAIEKKAGYFEVSPPRKRNMAHRQQQQLDSPDCTRRRVSAPPTPTSQLSVNCKMQLRSYLNDEQENKPPSRASDAFEVSLSLNEQSRIKIEERKTKMFQRMAATRKSQQIVQRSTSTVTKPLRTRNAPKKK